FQGGTNVYTNDKDGKVTRLANNAKVSNPAGGTASGVDTITAEQVMRAQLVRNGVTKLRDGSVPWTDGEGLYKLVTHPDVALDLRRDAGPAGWRTPHEYGAQDEIWRGVTGVFEGAAVCENPRCFNALDGAGTPKARLYQSYLLGMHATVEAIWKEASFVAKPMDDALDRFFRVGWKIYGGWAKYRPESLVTFVNSSSMVV
ncbi:hypothetical protein, partial [Streptomyces hydrogenans]